MSGGTILTVIMTIIGGIIGLAMLSVILGRNAQTTGVINASGSALSNVINAAVSPVTTSSTNGHLGLSSLSSVAGGLSSAISPNGIANLSGLFG